MLFCYPKQRKQLEPLCQFVPGLMTGSSKNQHGSVGVDILAPVEDVEAAVQQVQAEMYREESHDRARSGDVREVHFQKFSSPDRLLG
jgi:hypothetical protein